MTTKLFTPIPGPFITEGKAIRAVTHGKWFTVARVDGVRITDEAQREMATYIARCLNTHEDLLNTLRVIVDAADATVGALPIRSAIEAARRVIAGE